MQKDLDMTALRQPGLLSGTRGRPGSGRTSLLPTVSGHHLTGRPRRAMAFSSPHNFFAISTVAYKALLYRIIKRISFAAMRAARRL